ncbi:archaellin/type IV pilin N-terminal domain-containing protein [Halobiforma nitratireducens]|uniref:Flagellin n=1 Tax=Halobiforma nitratireducens JCM 10879 TaxID=1227454 RepID=M0LFT1_9EURY|nr:archaellin/type IV pilin N-terminal domain-containing protein [Halobiforma nitratireducens]EMA32401.1 flagellin A1 [Halobiforma nitratireducens JCM 10879]
MSATSTDEDGHERESGRMGSGPGRSANSGLEAARARHDLDFESETGTNTEGPGRDRAQVGIGTLILFVAMVLVAAIAAGVLINTAGQLQNQAQATGEQSTAEVANNLDIYTAVGEIDTADGTTVDTVEVTVGLGAGSDPIDLERSVLDFVGPNGQAYLQADGDDNGVTVSVNGDDERAVLESGDDHGTIRIDFDEADALEHLESGDDAQVTVVTQDSAQVVTELRVPSVLDGDDGDTVRL